MSVVLLIALLASFVSLVAVAILFSDGETRRARRILLLWSVGAAAYFAILIAVAMRPHESAFKTGAPYCDDDVCVAVDKITRTDTSYRLDVRLISLANRGPRSTKGASVYLTDEQNRRYLPVYDPSAIPFDVTLQPRQSVRTSLTFHVPPDAKRLFFAASMDHIRYASFVIGIGDLAHNPRVKFQIQ